MNTCGHCGGSTLARRKSGPALPRSTFGTPEDLIDRGVDALAKQTERLGEAIARAVHGESSAKAIQAAIKRAGRAWNRERLADPLEREVSVGQWLGALDADFEARTNRPVAVPSFAALHAPVLFAPYDRSTDPAFATRPVKDAREQFERRQAVTRDVYDAMSEAARRRSVTVAGAATNEIVRVVQRELVRQVSDGADLRDFSKRVVPRLEAAGWTPQNPSHVENVLRTNVGTAYNAGRYRQMTQPAVLRFRPYWQIVTVNDGPPRQRATHQAVHLVVLEADDPFWIEAYPPFGYQCRCRVRSLSRREGEPLVVRGTSIRDLPDPGFTSGVRNLDVPPPPPLPPMPPANDPTPAPANDVPPPPKPRKPRAPRKPKPPLSAPERFERMGAPVAVVAGEAPMPLQQATARGFEAALGRGGKLGTDKLPGLDSLQMTSRLGKVDFDKVALPEGCGGVYWRSYRTLRVGTADEHIEPFFRGDKTIHDYDPSRKMIEGRRLPMNSNNVAATREQVVEMTACHELAHHIHMSPLTASWDDLQVRADPSDAADQAIAREFARSDNEPVSGYAMTDRFEFFAEALTAYRYYDRAWMQRHRPRTVRLVRQVLKLRGLK